MAVSDPELEAVFSKFSAAIARPHPFRPEEFEATGQDYYGLVVPAGPFTVVVARASDADALAQALLRRFALDVAWIIPIFAVATLAVGVWSIRRGLAPVRLASECAAAITPTQSDIRLPVDV